MTACLLLLACSGTSPTIDGLARTYATTETPPTGAEAAYVPGTDARCFVTGRDARTASVCAYATGDPLRSIELASALPRPGAGERRFVRGETIYVVRSDSPPFAQEVYDALCEAE